MEDAGGLGGQESMGWASWAGYTTRRWTRENPAEKMRLEHGYGRVSQAKRRARDLRPEGSCRVHRTMSCVLSEQGKEMSCVGWMRAEREQEGK